MSTGIKLVLMGVAGAAVLYSCAPGAGIGALPYLWFLPNPFYRPPIAANCAPGMPPASCAPVQQSSSGSSTGSGYVGRGATSLPSSTTSGSQATPAPSRRGGFGSTGSTGSS
ncbi:MAG: hypothetical protein KA171_08445 [Reyranella sp.]|nr:hypothetical protein [Reyranella sp.]